MPWRCPACRTEIRHQAGEDRPHKGEQYRCHVCRLELVVSTDGTRLDVTPLDADGEAADDKPRAIPLPAAAGKHKRAKSNHR